MPKDQMKDAYMKAKKSLGGKNSHLPPGDPSTGKKKKGMQRPAKKS